jgi:hypothetical protein
VPALKQATDCAGEYRDGSAKRKLIGGGFQVESHRTCITTRRNVGAKESCRAVLSCADRTDKRTRTAAPSRRAHGCRRKDKVQRSEAVRGEAGPSGDGESGKRRNFHCTYAAIHDFTVKAVSVGR